MAKLAKLRLRELRSWRIWESLVRYANVPDDRSGRASNAEEFQALLSNCMDWIGGTNEDIAECGDFKEGTSLLDLEARYRADIRRALTWLSDPDQHSELAARAARFLSMYGTGVRM